MFSKLHNKEKLTGDDTIINITKYNKQLKKKEVVSEGFGSWLGHVTIDGEKFWDFKESFSDWKTGTEYLLESDSRKRPDLIELRNIQPDYTKASNHRDTLDQQYRNDIKLRTRK